MEIQVREFDPKLLLSCAAAEHGMTVWFGSQSELHARVEKLPRGVYVAKDVRGGKLRILKILKALGHRVVAWDEEGLVRYPPGHYYRTRISEPTLAMADMFFAWGEEDAAVVEAFPGYQGTPVVRTGNPRVDLLRPEFWSLYGSAAQKLKERFGRYILINTNFGFSNHFLGKPTAEIRPQEATPNATEQEWLKDLAEYRDRMFAHFERAVPAIGRAFPETTVILRPHPSEHHEAWRKAAADYPNVHVVHEGGVVPWIFGADVIVHNGCTTAIESFLVGRPAVTYQPMQSERFDRHLPDALSHPARDLNELEAQIRRFLGETRSPAQTPEQIAVLDRHLAVRNGTLACDQIVSQIQDGLTNGATDSTSRRERFWGWREAKVRRFQKRMRAILPGGKCRAYDGHRFPGVTEDEVNERIADFSRLLDRFHRVRARQYGDGVFQITSSPR